MRTLESMLAYEAKRRPEIAQLIERVGELTDDEIATVAVPLPWYRKALTELRDKTQLGDRMTMTWAAIKDHLVEGFVPDLDGTIYRWDGDDDFIPLRRDNFVHVKNGTLFWISDKGGMWIDTLFTTEIDPGFMSRSVAISRGTKLQYREAYRAKQLKYLDANAPVLSNASQNSVLGQYNVRFS